jgi:hypothetical protein
MLDLPQPQELKLLLQSELPPKPSKPFSGLPLLKQQRINSGIIFRIIKPPFCGLIHNILNGQDCVMVLG